MGVWLLASCGGGGDDEATDGAVAPHDGAGGGDAAARDSGGGTMCGLAGGSRHAYVMYTPPVGESRMFRIALDGEVDEYLFDVRDGATRVHASDFILTPGYAVFAASPSFYRAVWPPPAGTQRYEVGPAIEMTAAPPTTLGAIAGNQSGFWAVQSSRTLVHFDLDTRTWESRGGVPIPADCTGIADFVGIPAPDATTLSVLVTCSAAPRNRVFQVTLGTPNTSQVTGMLDADEALHNVLADGTWFGGSLWTGGIKRRPMRYCVGGSLTPIQVNGAEASP